MRKGLAVLAVVVVAALLVWVALDQDKKANLDVQYVPTPDTVVAAMLKLAAVREGDTVYDLGSGDGRIVLAAARDRGARAVGIEIDPALVEQSQKAIVAAGLTNRASVRRGDIFKQDLTPATVITLFLQPHLNAQLRPQLEKCRRGTRIVSHQFSMPGAMPVKTVIFNSPETAMEHPLYLWITPIDWQSSRP